MENWYLLMLLSITLTITKQVKPMNFKYKEPQTQPTTFKTTFNPILSYQDKSYDSGVLFEQISNVRISEYEFWATYNMDISKFTHRNDLLVQYKFEIELFCLHLKFVKECDSLLGKMKNYIAYGEHTMSQIMTGNITTVLKSVEITNLTTDESIAPLAEFEQIVNIVNQTNHIMTQQLHDSKLYIELLYRIDSTNILNIFPSDAISNYYNHIKDLMPPDEELLINLPIEDINGIFLASSYRTEYNSKMITLYVVTPTIKKHKYTLLKTIPITSKTQNKTLSFKPNNYFLLNSKQTQLIPLNDTTSCKINIDQNTRVCLLAHTPLQKQNHSCEQLFFNKTTKDQLWKTCPITEQPNSNQIIKIKSQSLYHCIINEQITTIILCKNHKPIENTLTNCRSRHISPNCTQRNYCLIHMKK